MLVAATVVFLYYTFWTLFMVRKKEKKKLPSPIFINYEPIF